MKYMENFTLTYLGEPCLINELYPVFFLCSGIEIICICNLKSLENR